MDYHRIYTELINNRKSNPVSGYTENHHILPKCVGGGDEPENLVSLTGREHWIAHLLLHKIYKRKETAQACHCMAMMAEERGIPKVRNSRMYQSIRESLVPVWRDNGKRRVGSANGSYGTRWICNIELQENKKISKDAVIPDGWIAGRNKWKDVIRSRELLEKQTKQLAEKKQRANTIYSDFVHKGITLQEYAEQHYEYSFVSLHKLFKNYVDSYTLTQGKRKRA